jgi:hypothetical protein
MCVKIRRKSYWKKACLGSLLALTATCAFALKKDNLVFYDSFDKSMNADKAKGKAKAEVIGKPELVEGKIGQAVKLTNLKDGILFDTKGNFPRGSHKDGGMGTISFWISPIGWDANSSTPLMPLISTQPQVEKRGDSTVTIQTVWPRNKINMMIYNTYKPGNDPEAGFPGCLGAPAVLKASTIAEAMNSLRPGTWYHIVLTWREGRLEAYTNGQLTGQLFNKKLKLLRLGKKFALGFSDWKDSPLFIDPGCDSKAAPSKDKEWQYIIDDLAIFDRALHSSQVKSLYGSKNALDYSEKEEPDPAVLETYYYNHKNLLKLKVSCEFEPKDIGGIEIEIRDEGSSFPLYTLKPIYDEVKRIYSTEFDAANLKRKRYDVQAYIVGKDGKRMVNSNLRYFRRERPIWYGNNYGKKDVVLPPWIPLQGNGYETRMWGRKYRFNGDLTIKELFTQEKQILSRPMNLVFEQDGKQHKIKVSKQEQKFSEAKTNDFRRNFGNLGTLQAETKATTGYDGFVRWDLRLNPKDAKATVDKLYLEIPIKREHAYWIHTPCRRPGEFKLTKAQSANFYSDRDFSGNWSWTVAFHDNEVGFQWAMESDQYWSNNDKQINVLPSDKEVILRLNIIDHPTTIDKPVSYSFAFQGLPVKPLFRPYGKDEWPFLDKENKVAYTSPVPDQKLYSDMARNKGYYGEYLVSNVPWWLSTSGAKAGDFCFKQYPDAKALAPYWWKPDQEPKLKNNGISYTFMGTFWSSFNDKGFPLTMTADIFGTDWAVKSDVLPVQKRWGFLLANPKMGAYRDYLAFWTHKRLMEQVGIYYDHSSYSLCSNIEGGTGWVDEEGTVHPTIPIFAARETQMRAYATVKEVRPYGCMIQHGSGIVFMGVDAFCDYKFDGENMQWGDNKERRQKNGGYWSESLTEDYLLAEYNPRPWGYGPSGCWQVYDIMRPENEITKDMTWWEKVQPKYLRDFRAAMFLIGRPMDCAGYSMDLGAWGRNYPMENVTDFVGYWKQKAFSGLGKLKVSCYPAGQRDQLMITVGNLTFDEQTQDISVDLEQLKKETGRSFSISKDASVMKVKNIETGEELPVDGNKFSVKLGKKDYRNLLLSWHKPEKKK